MFVLSYATIANAQNTKPSESKEHLNIAFTAGSAGLGFDLEMPITSWLKVRTGADFMPHLTSSHQFTIQVGEEYSKDNTEKMIDVLHDLTGNKVDEEITMDIHPVMNNAKLLFDIYPLTNKHWHATAGFYYGSGTFAKGANNIKEAPSMVAVSMYNNLHRIATNDEPIIVGSTYVYLADDIKEKLIGYGRMGIDMGHYANDIYDEEGNMIHAKGDKFLMEPDNLCELTETMYVNKFKPYIGIGYSGKISDKDDRWKFGVDCGAMFWGGHPTMTMTRKEQTSVYNEKTDKFDITNYFYDIDLTRDVYDLPSNVQKRVDSVKSLKIYPVIELRLAYRLF